uniref:FH2 domain-containing protein n=1 Tax=Meloidogyne hapla TaxID=6305 RepID=A0A1I8AZQ2_MELHA
MAEPPPPAAGAPPPATARAPSVAPKKGARAATSSSSGARLGVRDAEIKSLTDVRPALAKWLLRQDYLFGELEKISGLDREKLFYIFCGFFSVYMVAGPGCGCRLQSDWFWLSSVLFG